jgi:hypothetical protein
MHDEQACIHFKEVLYCMTHTYLHIFKQPNTSFKCSIVKALLLSVLELSVLHLVSKK